MGSTPPCRCVVPVAESESASESRCASRAIASARETTDISLASAALAYAQKSQKLHIIPASCFHTISTLCCAPQIGALAAVVDEFHHAIHLAFPAARNSIDMACWWRTVTAEIMFRILLTERLA